MWLRCTYPVPRSAIMKTNERSSSVYSWERTVKKPQLTVTEEQSLREYGTLVPGKTKSEARGLGCCPALLSTAFNMKECNSESDHIDRQLLTMSGEKVICQLFHCGTFCMTATHATEQHWELGIKKKRSHCFGVLYKRALSIQITAQSFMTILDVLSSLYTERI